MYDCKLCSRMCGVLAAWGLVMVLLALGCGGSNHPRSFGDGGDEGRGDVMGIDGSRGDDVVLLDARDDRGVDASDASEGGLAMEVCFNGVDDDGDGRIDDGCACLPGETQRCYTGPADRAGVGACAWGMQRCEGTSEFGEWGACEGAALPSAELCDSVDNDCDGALDNGCECRPMDTRGCYTGPAATRGIGACRDGTQTCMSGPDGVGSTWGRCAGEVLPASEICDGIDNDCNGTVDDGCGCRPGETRACYGGPMGTAGVGPCRAGTQTCEVSGSSSVWGACAMQVLPAPELCDGVDNNCDGVVDDGCACTPGETRACYTGPLGTRGIGLCRDGTQTCVSGPGGVGSAWGACSGEVLPGSERCDELDNNCNGVIDDGCACRMGDTRACYTGPSGTQDVGICRAGSQSCVVSGGVASWSSCTGQTLPATEMCDGIDNDCDGTADDGCACTPGETRACYTGPSGTQGVGICAAGSQTCTSGSGGGSAWGTCTGQTLPARESCNMIDDDCDGAVDDGISCSGPTVMCPAPVTVAAGSTVILTATATGAASYLWEVVSSPPGSTWTFGSPTSASTTFTSVIVGTYTIRVTVTDSMGRSASCTTTVTMQPHGFRVELSWDTTGTDIDLHVHNSSATAWFGSPRATDCFFSERNPRWDTMSSADDPSLDVDDRDGLGPENIRVDSPVLTQVYSVGVHYWAGSPRTSATVRIYCGDALAATYTRALNGGPAGSTTNDFWRVARVRFTSPSTCTVTRVDDVITYLQSRTGNP